MGQGHTKVLSLESVNHGLWPSALCPPCPSPIQLAVQVRQVPVPPEARGLPPPWRLPGRQGCLPAGRSQAPEADGAELRGERPYVGPQKLRGRPFERPSPGTEPTWLKPESAAAKGSPGRGIYKPVPGLSSKERKGSPGHVQRQELQGASHSSVPFTQVYIHVPALSAIPRHSPFCT